MQVLLVQALLVQLLLVQVLLVQVLLVQVPLVLLVEVTKARPPGCLPPSRDLLFLRWAWTVKC